MECLGRFKFIKGSQGKGRARYPWVEAEVGDWFMVYSETDPGRVSWRNAIVNSLTSCAWRMKQKLEWQPKFQIKEHTPRVVEVRRIA